MALPVLTTITWIAFARAGGQDQPCNNLPPGFDKMQMGIDIANFDQFAPDPGFLTYPVIDVTCNFNYTWKHPINGQVYDRPDQLTSQPVALPYDVTEYLSLMELTTDALELNMAVSVSESYLFGMFSKTTSVSNSFKYLSEQSRFVGAVNSTTQAFKMDLWSPEIEPTLIKLSPQAQLYVDTLPAIFDQSTVDKYDKFFANWGTHYNTEAYTGGFFRCLYYTSESFIGVMDKAQIEAQAGLYFMGFLQKSGAIAATVAPAAAAFKQATLFECHCSPTCPDSAESYEQWQDKASYYPWLISVKYAPVTDLITNATLKANMIIATANYLAHSYLQYEVLPALSIFATVINTIALQISRDPSCPIPDTYSYEGTDGGPNCAASQCSSATWVKGCAFCRPVSGAPFQTDFDNVEKQQVITNNTIYSLTNEANAMLKEPIINITQLTLFGNQFIALTNVMESGIMTKQCQWGQASELCFDDEGSYHWCKCVTSGVACNCATCPHNYNAGPLNAMSYLKALDVA